MFQCIHIIVSKITDAIYIVHPFDSSSVALMVSSTNVSKHLPFTEWAALLYKEAHSSLMNQGTRAPPFLTDSNICNIYNHLHDHKHEAIKNNF